MTQINFYTECASTVDADVLVLAVAKKEGNPTILSNCLPKHFKEECEQALKILGTDALKKKSPKL